MEIIIFIILIFGLGKFLCRNESALPSAGLGLAAIVVMGAILNVLRIPVDWRIFFGFSMIMPTYYFIQWIKRRAEGKGIKYFLKRPSWQVITVGIVFIFTLAVYCWGSFQFPWLENDDSWSLAGSIKHVSVERSIDVPDGLFQYLNPYPPGYSIVIGVLHQINPSLYWTLKFFNGFIICLGFLFFYSFAQEFSKSKTKAALATFFLALIPCYLTHFIWAHALVVTLFFPAFYFLLKLLRSRKHVLPASVCCAAIFLTQPTQAIKFLIMAVILVLCHIPTKIQWKNIGLLVLVSGLLASIWWGPVGFNALQGRSQIVLRDQRKISGLTRDTRAVMKKIFSPVGGSATQAYSWQHYLFIPRPSLINNPVGLGPVFFFLGILGTLFLGVSFFKSQRDPCLHKPYGATTLLWLTFIFLGMNSQTFNLPVGLFAFRFWMLFAIVVALLSAEALCAMYDFFQIRWNKIIMIIFFLGGIVYINLPFKWNLNTSIWTYGVHWANLEDIRGYLWMKKNFPMGTRVFTFTDNILVLGHDMRADFWSKEYQQRLGNGFDQEIDDLFENLALLNYEYLVISPRDVLIFEEEEVNRKIKFLNDDPRFRPVFSNASVRIFQIRKVFSHR